MTFAPSGRRYRVVRAEFVPTYIDQSRGGVRLYDVLAELRRDDLSASRRALLRAVVARTSATVRATGTEIPLAEG